MITRTEVLMGRDSEFPLDNHMEENLDNLLIALNAFRLRYGKPMVVSSGYRPGRYNGAANGAPRSNHMVCLACDFSDPLGDLDQWITMNEAVLAECGLWREAQAHTIGWCHLQCVPYKSWVPGKSRSFNP